MTVTPLDEESDIKKDAAEEAPVYDPDIAVSDSNVIDLRRLVAQPILTGFRSMKHQATDNRWVPVSGCGIRETTEHAAHTRLFCNDQFGTGSILLFLSTGKSVSPRIVTVRGSDGQLPVMAPTLISRFRGRQMHVTRTTGSV